MAGSREEAELMRRRGLAFLRLARYSSRRKPYDVAAFNAEQAAQLFLKATLLELVGDFPRTHSTIFLLKELQRVGGKEVERFLRRNKRGLHHLEDAYLASRYFYKSYDREDVEYLISLAEEVVKFCEGLKNRLGKGRAP